MGDSPLKKHRLQTSPTYPSYPNHNMAPVQLARTGKDKRLNIILGKSFSFFLPALLIRYHLLAFAAELQAQLPASTKAKTPAKLLTEIENQISNFPAKFGTIAASKFEEIDEAGTTIWNLCTRLRRAIEPENPKDIPIILLLARVFSFLLLDGAYDGGRNAPGNLARLIKIGIKAGKSCIG
jgi:hypothetical protein